MAASHGPLDGLRVLDFGRYIAGPFCGALLADLGADVIRVEHPDGGEDRALFPVSSRGDGAYLLQMNRNKRGLTLDTTSAHGREVLKRLVAGADILVANLPQDARRKLGIDYETLRKTRPDIIAVSISAFGDSGPYANRVGFDGVGQAMCGSSYLSGQPGFPSKSFTPWADFLTAALATAGVLAAVHERHRTGKGRELECSLLASAIASMSIFIGEQAAVQCNRVASGNRIQSSGPGDYFQTTDGWIVVQCVGAAQFGRWAKLIGAAELVGDPRFATDALRADNGAVLSERMQPWCRERSSEEALDALAKARVPAGPILSPQQVMEDAHVMANALLTMAEAKGDLPRFAYALSAVKMSGQNAPLRRAAPSVGEHTAEVLQELGYSAAEIAALRAARCV